MPKRLITAVVAALALVVAAPASAQTPTPTPTATSRPGSAPANATQAVKRIYNDYTSDGKIDVCDHARKDLQEALDTIEVEFDTDYPDFREALEAGIQRHDKGRCDDATPTPTATATETASPSPTTESGALPPPDDSGGGGSTDDGGGALPSPEPETGTLPPTDSPTPAAPVPSAVPTVPPATAAAPTAAPTPAVLTSSNTDALLVPGILVAIALLGGALLGVWALAARRNPRWAHAWDEAGYRVKSTWADFSDWLKLGR